ncbi:MAG: substrate-binding domain-containing protein [Eubacteriales bacterium]
MKAKKNIAKFAAVLLLISNVLIFSACGKEEEFINDDDTIKIGLILETMTVERWQRDRDVFVARAKELDAEVIVTNAYEDAERQNKLIRELVAQGVDVLAIVAYDKETLSDSIKYAHDNNVKVIAYDRLISEANVDLYISFDNYEVGRLIGQSAVDNVPEGKYLILNGARTDSNAYMLNEGCMSILQPYIDEGKIEVVDETWIEAWRDEVSYKYVNDAIESGLEFDVIIAANDRVAEGALNALSEYRMIDDVYITGQDAELAACQRIVEGIQDMTVYKPISVLAEGAAEIAVKMAKGESIGPCDLIDDGKYKVKYIAYEPIAVNKDNMLDTVIKGGFYPIEQVYANIDKEDWPIP